MENKDAKSGQITSGKNISFWSNTINPVLFNRLEKNTGTNVVIVGGGIAGVTIAYCLLQSGKNKPQHVKTIELVNIPCDEGKIVEPENRKMGACRDKNDQIHIVDAECTHLKCMVKWNNDQKTWDCPCHGSRFFLPGKGIKRVGQY